MRVLIISQYFWPENFRINDLVLELEKKGHEITLLTGIPNYPDGIIFQDYKKNPNKYSKFSKTQIIRIPIILRSKGMFKLILNYLSFVFSASIFGIYKLKNKKFDVIFIYEPSPITVALPAILFSKIRRIPTVFWVLDLWPDTLSAVGIVKSRLLLKILSFLSSFIYNRVTMILGQSQSFIPSILKYCKRHKNVYYFPSWSEIIFRNLDNIKKANEITEQKKCFNIIFAGNIGEAQDFPSIIRCIKLLKNEKNIRWFVIGDGRKYNWLKNQIKIEGLEKNIYLIGRYPIDRMPSFFAHADALLISLKNEKTFSMTIPAKLQTYLASGIPILGMLNGEGAEIINNSQSGFACNAGNYEELSKLVKKLSLLSKKEREAMGIYGKQYSSQIFDREILIKKLENFFIQAIKINNLKN